MAKVKLAWRHRKRDENGVVTSLDCGCKYDCHTGIFAKSCDNHKIGQDFSLVKEGNPFTKNEFQRNIELKRLAYIEEINGTKIIMLK
jgi:hypothetical protein